MQATENEIIKALQLHTDILGKVPSRSSFIKEHSNLSITRYTIVKLFSSYYCLVIKAGLIPNRTPRKDVETVCTYCKKAFLAKELANNGNRFCSRKCSVTYSNKLRAKLRIDAGEILPYSKIPKICINCNSSYVGGTSTCSYKCRTEYTARHKTVSEACTEGDKQQKFNNIRCISRTYAKYFLPPHCQCCGYDKHTEIAHIQALSSFPSDTILLKVIGKDNMLSLCPNCHWEFDYGNLTLIDIKKSKYFTYVG